MLTELEDGSPLHPVPPDPKAPTYGVGRPPTPRPEPPTIDRSVMNLSSHELTEDQHRTLELGLKFIPTPRANWEQSHKHVVGAAREFIRRLHIIYFFHLTKKKRAVTHPQREEPEPYSANSSWSPPLDTIPAPLRQAGGIILQGAHHIYHPPPINNLTRAQRKALGQLTRKASDELTIRKADKGAAAIIMDRPDYLWEGERQLLNEKYYHRLRKSWYHFSATLIPPALDKWKSMGLLKARQHQHLQPPTGEDLRARRFYMLPKIHKDPTKWPVPNRIPPGRPIVSDCSSEGYHLSTMIDHFLQKIATAHPAYLKDTWHFIECLGQITVPTDALIVTCDVASMYTNIDIPAALKIIEKEVEHIRGTPGLPPTEDFIRMLRLSLERNDFKFNGSFYLQLKGTAMGKKYAPSFANIFMADWEGRMLDQARHQPALYKRFLDDIFMIWTGGEHHLTQFLQQANALDSSIQLEAEWDNYGLPYLDTFVYKGARHRHTGHLDVRLYTKPTSSLDLLDPHSHHPPATFRGIVKSQLIRYWNINTDEAHYNLAVRQLFHNIRSRPASGAKKGYDKRTLRRIKMEVRLEREGHIPLRRWPRGARKMLRKPTRFTTQPGVVPDKLLDH